MEDRLTNGEIGAKLVLEFLRHKAVETGWDPSKPAPFRADEIEMMFSETRIGYAGYKWKAIYRSFLPQTRFEVTLSLDNVFTVKTYMEIYNMSYDLEEVPL
jgi:hypothetical protein